jgi:hypothetical protein
VRISSRLRERYPEQMTIVLQFQYWDLKVTDAGFEVGLSFSDVPERLEIPFSAVRGFYDPSVNFELEFDVKAEASAPVAATPAIRKPESVPAPKAPAKKPEPKPKAEAPKPTVVKPVPEKPKADAPGKSADVVSLDAFRKK